jgi:hypothetical protein
MALKIYFVFTAVAGSQYPAGQLQGTALMVDVKTWVQPKTFLTVTV